MDGHSVLGRFAIKVSTLPPEEAKKVAMFWVDMDLVEHALHVTRKGYRLLTESSEYANQVIGEIRTLEEMSVEGCTSKFDATVEDDSYFLWFLRVVYPMMRDIPHLAILQCSFFSGHFLGITTVNDIAQEGEVVLSILAVGFQPPLQLSESPQSYFVVW